MREINECTAEVFRRSEKIIKERRKARNRVLALCIPICFFVTVWSVTILPAMMAANKSDGTVGEGMDMVGGVDGSDVAFSRVEVVNTESETPSSIINYDTDEVEQIYVTLQSSFVTEDQGYYNDYASTDVIDDGVDVEENVSQSETTTMSSGYRIVFTSENGSQLIYSLVGDKLINEATKQETVLTAEQRSIVLNMLGLIITWEEELQ